MLNLDPYRARIIELETELGVELSLGYIGNLDPRTGDDRSWSVDVPSMAVDTTRTEGRGPWSHRASGTSYPATPSWTTDAFPTLDEFDAAIRLRVARERVETSPVFAALSPAARAQIAKGGATRTAAEPFEVEYGVHGAHRISHRQFATLGEAQAFAERWARSNSQGHYWAEVSSVSVGGSTPGTTVVHARLNLAGVRA